MTAPDVDGRRGDEPVWPPPPRLGPSPDAGVPPPTPSTSALWLIVLFDILVGGSLFLGFSRGLESGASEPDEPSAYEAQWRLIDSVNTVVALCGAALLIGAAVCILAWLLGRRGRFGRGASLLQRGASWCLPLLTAILVLSLSMPSVGGVGGFLMLLALPVCVLFTVLSLWAALRVRRLENVT